MKNAIGEMVIHDGARDVISSNIGPRVAIGDKKI